MAKRNFMDLMREKTADLRPSLLTAEADIKQRLIVLDSLRNLIPPLLSDELAQLTQNLLEHGVKDPLTIWETTARTVGIADDDTLVYVLIDGHNRYSIVQEHRLDFRINLIRFASLNEAKTYMIDYQLGRRNLSAEQASYLRGTRYNELKIKRGDNLKSDTTHANVANVLAEQYGVSTRTIKRDGKFAADIEQLPFKQKQDVLSGKQKVARAEVASLVETSAANPVTKYRKAKANVNNAPENHLEAIRKIVLEKELTQEICIQLKYHIDSHLANIDSK